MSRHPTEAEMRLALAVEGVCQAAFGPGSATPIPVDQLMALKFAVMMRMGVVNRDTMLAALRLRAEAAGERSGRHDLEKALGIASMMIEDRAQFAIFALCEARVVKLLEAAP